jgi:hypothetical protein
MHPQNNLFPTMFTSKIAKLYLLIVSLIVFNSCNLSPGFYPNAERYELEVKESKLIELITELKVQNPSLALPESSLLADGRRDSADKWYHFYFYSKEENMIIKTWVRGVVGNANETIFAFVAINEGLELGNWKSINKDFSSSENRRLKSLFENMILLKVKEKI